MRHAEPTRQGRPISWSAAYLDVSALDRVWKINAPEADVRVPRLVRSDSCSGTPTLQVRFILIVVHNLNLRPDGAFRTFAP